MEQIGVSLATTLGLLFITFVGPVAAMIVLSRRKRAVRAARRSPLTADLLRPPGYTLREKIEDIRMDVAFDVAILMVIPTLMTALYLLQRQINPRPPSAWMAVVLAVGVLWIVARWTLKLHQQGGELDRPP